MNKIALTSVTLLSVLAGTTVTNNTALAKKHSLKHQTLSSVVLKDGKLSGIAKTGSKITIYHGKKILKSSSIKTSHFTFKLKGIKKNWKIKLTATKKGYAKASKTVTARVTDTVTIQPKRKKEYFSDSTDTLVLKQGKITFGETAIEPSDFNDDNFLVFIRYTNTTSEKVDLSLLLIECIDATQNVGSVTKTLSEGWVADDSAYYDAAQIVDDSEYVNPGETVTTVATWELVSDTAPIELSFSSPENYNNLGALIYE
ncbi:hypothetical protein GCM10022296_04700 [Secundilactobacillus similis DSM 23365 = JCM 2765]|uniref:DUF5067 domain-containing protein n=1 Tax=Secundilactobacillus similis DSM 23365 = JCM 2765 TaxID=1423804 RepID=A0A0R2FIW4_9LACO|nr:DUF5067 domain-containing protein [Secundilactobacillus similis]KRN26149.1 hypothetical protein FD14_GL003050 [Secundilactobacillus similis DSM 23365 = JCM 2765]